MTTRRTMVTALILFAGGCSEPLLDPTAPGPSLHHNGHNEHRTIIVDPRGRHDATTIQAGIDLAPPGGRVLVLSGTYAEVLIITKGVTLEAKSSWDRNRRQGGDHDDVIVSPPGTPLASIDITSTDPVTIRNLTVLKPGVNGILGTGVVDITLEHLTLLGSGTGPGTNRLVRIVNNAGLTGGRARLVVRESFMDANLGAATLAISINADVEAHIEDNTLRRTGGPCIFVQGLNPDGVNVDIVNNDLDECQPAGRAAAIDIGPIATPGANIGMTGVVNIVGNKIRNSQASCLPTTAIRYELYTGRIEHNSIVGFVQQCAEPILQALPAAIWVGSLRGYTPSSPIVRFNDIQGNAHAGLRVAPNIATSIDARCNYWGSETGPAISGGTGTGDSILVEAGAGRPVFMPFATGPIAERRGHHRDHPKHHGDGTGHDRESCQLDFSLWSDPVNLGAVVNSPSADQTPWLSRDGLTLYFSSDRPGGFGGQDIWVSRRACETCAWEAPVNLGATVNTAGAEVRPSIGGTLMFFQTDRPGGQGATDIWVSHRADVQDDFGWEAPVNLGSDVNTTEPEQVPNYVPEGRHRNGTLHFARGPATVGQEIYVAAVARDGQTLGPATIVAELNDPTVNDAGPALRGDGKEIVFHSPRIGRIGGSDLWASTRASIHDPWSVPVNLGTPPNSTVNDLRPYLSRDGRTLVFDSNRPGVGGLDLWISTRTPIGHRDR